jgi:hypothetical protein
MANNSLVVSELDFSGLQQSLVSFMRNYPQFKDYDFSGSNLSTLIDLLAYNTYLNSFYTNMAINEMFLDTAVLRQSIISHAKDINYMPRSARSSQAMIDVQVFPNDNPPFIFMPAGQKFQGTNGNNVFTFVTQSNTIISPVGGTYISTNIPIYEGVPVTEFFVVNTAIENQRYILSNPNIDTTTLTVTATNELGIEEKWTYYSTLFGVKETTKAYFLQATGDNYEILFGDNISGISPLNGSKITAKYLACNKDLPNGISKFKSTSSIGGYSSYSVTTSSQANGTLAVATGGVSPESNSSIRFNAPRAYQTLERAVTAEDYRNILFAQFPEIRDVYVYGGEELTPPDYGRVYIAVDILNAVGLSDFQKNKIQSFISTRAPISISPVVIAAEYTFIGINCNVSYNLNQSPLSVSDIQGKILAAIQDYGSTNLEKFNAKFRYSQLLSSIDNTDSSIFKNETTTTLIKRISPTLNTNESYTLKYQNALIPESIISTAFTYNNLECTLKDDGNGIIKIISTADSTVTNVISIGTVDYTSGTISITNLNVSEFDGSAISLFASPVEKDVGTFQNLIMEIDFNNVDINVTGSRI